ncbi:MAG: hypothetical protein AB1758_05360 [Candidatus Eremiobacterota bacterium]
MRLKGWLVLLLVAVLGQSALAQNAAVVTRVKGEVTVETPGGGAAKKAHAPMKLAPGASLKLKAGAQVSLVYLADAHEETLTGPGWLKVGPTGQTGHEGELAVKPGPGRLSATPTGNTGKAGMATMRGPDDYVAFLDPARVKQDGDVLLFPLLVVKPPAGPWHVNVVQSADLPAYDESIEVEGKPGSVVTLRIPKSEFPDGTVRTVEVFEDVNVVVSFRFMPLTPEVETSLQQAEKWAAKSGDPNSYLFLCELAYDYAQLDRAISAAEQARTGLKKVSQASPEDTEAKRALGWVHARLYELYGERGKADEMTAAKQEATRLNVPFDVATGQFIRE